MYVKEIVFSIIIFFIIFSNAWADTAVSIQLTGGPALTEAGLATVDLKLPIRSDQALPLNVGDVVFFAAEPPLEGEGTIINMFETEDEAINTATIVEHSLQN